jgi:O-antigen ligase
VIGLSVLLICILVSVFAVTYKFARFEWLDKIAGLIIITLPFERIPSITTSIGTLKIGYALLGFGILNLIVLLLKKDPKLLALKLHPKNIWFLLFFIFSIPSWFFVVDFNRFLGTMIATIISFATAAYIANFSKNTFAYFKALLWVFGFILLFSIYQFLGDFVGLPFYLTGIREGYSSIVFGIPRVHATFIEPSYFASGLTIAIYGAFFLIATDLNVITKNIKKLNFNFIENYRWFYIGYLALALAVFVATLSKSGWLSLLISTLFIIPIATKYNIKKILKYIAGAGILGTVVLGVISLFSPFIQSTLIGIITHIIDTFEFNNATSVERSSFFSTALEILPNFIITGTGSGQFGTVASYLLKGFGNAEAVRTFLVLNAYLEVWFEFGLISFLIFVYLFFSSTFKNFIDLYKENVSNQKELFLKLSLTFILITALIQWNFFSPVYLNHIFIMLGCLLSLDLKDQIYETK